MASLFSAAVGARGYSIGECTDENNRVALVLELLRRDVLFFVDQTDHADGRRWIYHTCWALIV